MLFFFSSFFPIAASCWKKNLTRSELIGGTAGCYSVMKHKGVFLPFLADDEGAADTRAGKSIQILYLNRSTDAGVKKINTLVKVKALTHPLYSRKSKKVQDLECT